MDPTNRTMRKAINSFYSFWLPLHSYKDDLVLYHYTSLDGLIGILQTKSLWCTDTSSLNDPMELKYGKKLVCDKLKEKINANENNNIKKILNDLINHVEGFDTILYRVFIACFCDDDNLLSQWRAYAEKGVGYNIGFNFTTDTKFSHNPEYISEDSYIILRKIIYDTNLQNEIITKSIDKIIEVAEMVEKYWTKQSSGLPVAWSSQAALETVNILFDIVMSFKNPVFEREQEWRLIKVIDPDRLFNLLNFRNIYGRLTPYLKTIIYTNEKDKYFFPVSKIRFGPILDEKITKKNLELYIKNISNVISDGFVKSHKSL